MSRTTSATQLAPNLPMRRSVSCVKQFLGIGRTSVRGHRQFPHHQPQGFSGCDVNGVYLPPARDITLGLQMPTELLEQLPDQLGFRQLLTEQPQRRAVGNAVLDAKLEDCLLY